VNVVGHLSHGNNAAVMLQEKPSV